MKKILSFIFISIFSVCLLVGCSNKPIPANYFINNDGNLIVIYEDGTEENLGEWGDEIIDSLTEVTISDDGYYVINGIKTDIKAPEVISYELDKNGDLIVIYSDGTTENLGSLGESFVNGIETISISDDGFYIINGIKTDIKATEAWTVTFDTGFSETINSQSILDGDKVIRPDINREGYSLVGWFCNGEEWRFNSDVVLNNMTLTAKWKPNTYNVSFNTNEEFTIDDLTVEYDSSYELPVISKKGYTFLGWAFNGKIVQDEVWSIASDVVLSAEWSRNVYEISFDTQGGKPIDSLKVESYSTVETLPIPTKEDHVFLGWYLNNQLVTLPYEFSEGDICLVAHWKGIIDDFEFDKDESGEGIKITKYIGKDDAVIVPATISGKYVTTICSGAFNSQNIKSISFGPKIQEFEYKCFTNLSNLEKLDIAGNTVATLIYMFGGEEQIPDSLTEINFVDGTATYGKHIFDKLSPSRTFVLHVYSKLESTPEDAFFECPNISELHFEEGIKKFGNRTTCHMENLEYVNIPNTVESIGMNCFINIPKLKYLIVPKSVTEVDYAGLAATSTIILVEAESRPSSWGGSVFAIYEDEMDILYGFQEIRENADFIYALCKVGSFKQSIVIENKTNAKVPEMIDGYPVAERKQK